MTIWDLGAALGRRWAVVMVGFVLVAIAVLLVGHPRGAYWSRTQVTFLAPSSVRYPNSLETGSEDIIITAGIVAKRINGTAVMPKMASPDVTLFGRGITDGYSVLLPDTGGQWAPNFADQALDVQVIGPSSDGVRERQQALVDQIASELTALQDEAGVVDADRITVVPNSPDVSYLGGQPVRAAAMTALLGMGTVVGLVGLLEMTDRRRRQRSLTQGSDRVAASTLVGSGSLSV